MPVYAMIRVRIHDLEGYQRYFEAAVGVSLEAHGGKILAYDPEPQEFEGQGWWKDARAVLLEFETEQGFRAWYESPEYQAAARHRFEATESCAILFEPKPVAI